MKRTLLIIAMMTLTVSLAAGQSLTRGYDLKSSTVFGAKGQWIVGGNCRYSSSDWSDGKILVLEGIDATGYSLSVSPSVAYLISDNVAVGLRASYGRYLTKVDYAGMSFQDVDIVVDDYYSLSHKGSLQAFIRPYIPVGTSGRIALFAEIGASASLGQAKVTDGHTDDVKGTWQRSFSWAAGVYPGATAFITDRLAVELNVGLFGFDSAKTHQVHNQVDTGDRSSFAAHFMVDVTSLSIGLSLYL